MQASQPVNVDKIQAILKEKHVQIAMALKICAHCSICADSCFLYRCREQKPEYMPSHKMLNTLGIIYKKKGKITRKELEEMQKILWEKCVLCTRCYCPLGINIPNLISLARRICRSQGIFHEYNNGGTGFHAPPPEVRYDKGKRKTT